MQRPQFGFEFDDARIALLDGKLRGSELLSQLLTRELVIERGSVARRNSPRYARRFPRWGMVCSREVTGYEQGYLPT